MNFSLKDYIKNLSIPLESNIMPWDLSSNIKKIISKKLEDLGKEYKKQGDIAIHKKAVIEPNVTIKPPCIIEENCFIASYSYIRDGVWLAKNVIIGPACEVKSTFIFSGSKLAHFNFVGDSIIGNDVNIEAGAIIANYRNEREDKKINCNISGVKINTGVTKFGALVGDDVKIGANSVLAPGSIIEPGSIIKRLSLVDHD